MRPHILIVGAGITGLTTAITLGEGVERKSLPVRPRITILDAEGQAGGRARTEILSNGIAVDTGPHWFHGGRRNPFYRWAKARFDLGPVSYDPADRRVNLSAAGALAPEQREWALSRLFEEYAVWKAHHPDADISLATLATRSRSAIVRMVAEERAINWMAVDTAAAVSSDEFFGDDTGSGGVQLENGIAAVIDGMVERAEYYGADLHYRSIVGKIVNKSGGGFQVIDFKGKTYDADHVVVTVPLGVLKDNAIKFSPGVHERLQPVLDNLVVARMTKIFVPLRPEFFEGRGVAPDTFVTFYDQNHSWLCHVHTDGKPTVTLFACGAMSDLMEGERRNRVETEVLALLERIPLLQGCSDHVEGRIMVTGWTGNPNFKGAYSAVLPGRKRINPLHCGPIFAGEAFVADPSKSPGQMIGAWYSGRMVAHSLLRSLARRFNPS